MKSSGYSKQAARMGEAINAIARKCWRGLPALLGRDPCPGLGNIAEALEIARVDYPAAEIVNEWPRIVQAVQTVAAENQLDWSLYLNYIARIEVHRSRWGQRGVIDTLAEKKGLTPETVRQIIKSIPARIAALVSIGLTDLDEIADFRE